MELEKRIEVLEKRVIALEEQVQEQCKTNEIVIQLDGQRIATHRVESRD